MSSQYDTRFTSASKAQALELERKHGDQAARTAYVQPLVMTAVGFALGAGWPAVAALGEGGILEALFILVVYAVMLSISVVVGLIGLVVTCRLFGTGARSLWLGLVKLAGVFSTLLIAAALVGPLGCFGFIILIALMAGLIAWQFELELVEGLATAVVCWLVFLGMNVVIAIILAG